ncbi:MAG: DUF742 domain-containing protein [Dactylosporangium sp.]|nr:DUF742 domain-containing protein [Dactylosporangium sp.]NNJ62868.1 DUF742 domain-containing protein [Dactylosporangium sp.]
MNDDEPRVPDARMIPAWRAPHPPSRAGCLPSPGPREQAADEGLVRPFLVTRGRTQPLRTDLRLETLVEAQPGALHAGLAFESLATVEVCQTPQSVAEVAVRVGVPLGVARVLIADLITAGHLVCTQLPEVPLDLLERIRDRVRAL